MSKNNSSNREKQNGNSKGAKPSKSSKTALAVSIKNCQMCHQEAHYSYQCQKFQSATPAQRLQLVKKAKLFLNCLRDSHTTEACQSSNCRKCQVKHNTLLHDALVVPSENSQVPPEAPINPVPSSSGGVPASLVSNLPRKVISEQILLPTATIMVKGVDGRLHKCRALLDSCSQTNFVTNSFVQKSKLRTLPQGNHVVSGIGQHKTSSNNSTHFTFSSQDGNFTMDLDFIVLDSIVDDQPSSIFEVLWHIPAGIPLADFEYNIRSRIDVLLGAEVFMKALRSGRFEGSPTLQKTAFGYIIAGSTPCESTSAFASSCVSTCLCSLNMSDTLPQQMERFWTVEEPPTPEKILSKEEQLCETHFTQHTTRDSDGRFVVRLPLRDNLEALGKSETLALKRCFCIEKKLQRNPDLREKYVAFMREYESLGHMRLLPETYHSDRPPVYLPHHPVFKVSSSTPVRVVFDASAKTSSEVSLNDVLMVGPKTQDDLFAILLRFREHNIVVKADIKKMFRQVRVHSDDQNMQRIFWREAPHLPMNTYLLSTMTYGTGSASYLSTRCISKLVEEEGDNFPVAKPAASRDFYVDDFISGNPTVAEAQELQSQINLLMRKGGFQLSKWMSNGSEALKNIPLSEREITEPLDLSSTETITTLGLQWNPVSDEFTFKVSSSSQTITKRAILSEMSRIFDPLGLLAPVTIQAKILMQSLWLVKADWDDELVDTTVLKTWQEYQQNLKDLVEFRIPRHITSAH
ncbi:uncharacterized protein LOC129809061 [Phlebotomus papatasi]|uniref:uncharacterized protein LOC129809061 n=1 Tax=Phlebotomus papatasi TaxID=29031 RepID=UPI0024842D1A|nr:uncharacterized protein LOC129809061 [Phlebotomus papatasi]